MYVNRLFFFTIFEAYTCTAAWNFVETHKGKIGWDLVALCPSFVYGPILHEVHSPEKLNATMNEFANVVFKGQPRPSGFQSAWVDVRDVAAAHGLALEKEEAGGKRFLLNGGMFVWQDFCTSLELLLGFRIGY